MAEPIYKGKLTEPMFEGAEVVVRGFSFIVPELNFANARKYRGKILALPQPDKDKKLTPAEIEQSNDLMRDVALAALKQNYPDMTVDQLEEHFSSTQIAKAFRLATAAKEEAAVSGAPDPTAAKA